MSTEVAAVEERSALGLDLERVCVERAVVDEVGRDSEGTQVEWPAIGEMARPVAPESGRAEELGLGEKPGCALANERGYTGVRLLEKSVVIEMRMRDQDTEKGRIAVGKTRHRRQNAGTTWIGVQGEADIEHEALPDATPWEDPRMTDFEIAITVAAALGSGLAGGVFFAFSAFVMPALGAVSKPVGIAAMQSINNRAVKPPLMIALFGTRPSRRTRSFAGC